MLRALITSLIILAGVGCSSTQYSTFDPVSGQKVTEFKTTANVGIVPTGGGRASGSASTGAGVGGFLPGFGYKDQATMAFVEGYNGGEAPGITFPDGTKITGVLDHSTVADVKGHWAWRTARSALTYLAFKTGVGAWADDKLAGHATNQAKINSDQAVNVEQIRAGTNQAQIAADTQALEILNP